MTVVGKLGTPELVKQRLPCEASLTTAVVCGGITFFLPLLESGSCPMSIPGALVCHILKKSLRGSICSIVVSTAVLQRLLLSTLSVSMEYSVLSSECQITSLQTQRSP